MTESARPPAPSVHVAPPPSRTRAGPLSRLEGMLPLALVAAALAAIGGALYTLAVSRVAPHPVAQSILVTVVCLSFVGSGVVALRGRSYWRFGLLLAAVGFSSLLGVLHDANDSVAYTIGVFTSNLVFAVLLHALLAFPRGRLGSGGRRLLVAAYLDVLGLQAIAVAFDPLTRYHSDHPPNLALIDARPSLATGLLELEAAVAIALALTAAAILARRARAATPTARRQLVPVLWCGWGGLAIFAVALAVVPLSARAGLAGMTVGLLAALALPAAFLAIVLQGRLSRAAVGELLVELREQPEALGLEHALRRALGDPSLELARREAHGGYADGAGRELVLPGPGDVRVATAILHQGETIGALVHDRSLRLRPQLLDAVRAAAGFALANERALQTVQRVEVRNRALLDAIPDLMFRIARYGTYLDVRADDPSGLVRPPEELIGSNVRDQLPGDVTEAVLACVERALSSGAMSSVEYALEIDGVERCFESRMVPSGDGEVVTIVRDFTVQRRAEAEQRRLGEQEAALRRVATLVAGDAPPEQVFQTVTEEASRLLLLRSALLVRYEDARTATIVGKDGDEPEEYQLGSILVLDQGAALAVLRTGAPVRVDYEQLDGAIARRMLEHGFRSSVAVPITVAGATWGALIAGLRADETLPPETEHRLTGFAELVGLAVASADARDELAASRLRIVEASDDERRRIERNLHDGAQQRLVALSVGLRLARAKIRSAPEDAEELVAFASEELAQAIEELRELAQGIHPAVLTERGLAEALEVLAARTRLPVSLETRLPERLPEPVEAAAYYVVSEGLANVVKHAGAGTARVRVVHTNGAARVEVSDDGAGGADLDRGSGLWGLRDRVEALAGSLEIESAPGKGTLVRAELPVQ